MESQLQAGGAHFAPPARFLSQDKPKKSSRILAFDLVEALAIVLAVSMHDNLYVSGSIPSQLWMLLATCAVPAFMAVNGALLFSKPYSAEKQKARIIKIVTCILFWKLVILLVMWASPYWSIADYSKHDVLYYFIAGDTIGLPTGQFWFMYSLLTFYLFFPMFKHLYDAGEHRTIITFALVVLGFTVLPIDASSLTMVVHAVFPAFPAIDFIPFRDIYQPVSNTADLLPYFLLGPYAYAWMTDLLRDHSRVRIALIAAGIFIVAILIEFVQQRAYTGSWGWAWVRLFHQYEHIGTILLTASFLTMCLCVPFERLRTTWLTRLMVAISINTMTIYYVHKMLLSLSNEIILFHLNIRSLAFNNLRAVIVVLICLGLSLLLKKIPFFKRFA